MMSGEDEVSSRGPLTLKFFGVDDDETSSDEEKEEQGNTNQTFASDPVVNTCNGNSHSLTVNHCYGNRTMFSFSSKPVESLENNHGRNQLISIPYKTYFEQRERHWTFIPNTDLVVVNVAVSREHHFRLNPFL